MGARAQLNQLNDAEHATVKLEYLKLMVELSSQIKQRIINFRKMKTLSAFDPVLATNSQQNH